MSIFPLGFQIDPLVAKGKGLLDAIYPPRCMVCGEFTANTHGLCAACWREVPFVSGAICECCGTPVAGEAFAGLLCDSCHRAPPEWDRGRAAVLYAGHGRALVKALKHGDRLDLARPLGHWMTQAGAELLDAADCLIPVPLHWTRLFRRRYNQSVELARVIARITGLPVLPDTLRRIRRTQPHVQMGSAARAANQQGAFALAGRGSVKGKRVVLVDDVMTTGATLSACAGVLGRGEAAQVDVLVLARVAPPL